MNILERILPNRVKNAKKTGEGTFGNVYCFLDKSKGDQLTAAKVYKSDDTENGLPVDIIREVAFMKFMKHNNILNMYDFIAHGDSNVLLTKGMWGNLRDYLKKNKTDMNGKINICKSICNGIAYMHSLGFMHRDIKPQNVLIDDTLDVRISDFGSTRRYITGQCFTIEACTIWYRAPECLLGCGEYDLTSDVWSIGCTCLEIISEVPLFQSNGTQIDQIFKIFSVIGTYKMKSWANNRKFKDYDPTMLGDFKNKLKSKLNKYRNCPIEILKIFASTLIANPNRRPSSKTLCKMLSISQENGNSITSIVEYNVEDSLKIELDLKKRSILIDWIIEVNFAFHLSDVTLHLGVEIFDRYSAKVPLNTSEIQLYGITCLVIASKVNEVYPFGANDAVHMCDYSYSLDQVNIAEKNIIMTIEYDIVRINQNSIQLTQIQDKQLKEVVQYLYESDMIKAPKPKLDMKMARKIKRGSGISKTFNRSPYASIKRKFSRLHDSIKKIEKGVTGKIVFS
tara:strand:+ start:549 stop:2075 length:1527 start_codon:yes stop_codon:yes gene_type:complete